MKILNPCKNCPDRHPICHDSCPKCAEYKRQRGAEAAYTREMLDTGKVYHYDHSTCENSLACKRHGLVCGLWKLPARPRAGAMWRTRNDEKIIHCSSLPKVREWISCMGKENRVS